MREIVEPVMAGMVDEGHPFRGFLYVGLMLTADGPKVIEFNVRLGDPETQVILSLVDEPMLPLLVAAAEGRLRQSSCRLGRDKLVGVVIASVAILNRRNRDDRSAGSRTRNASRRSFTLEPRGEMARSSPPVAGC